MICSLMMIVSCCCRCVSTLPSVKAAVTTCVRIFHPVALSHLERGKKQYLGWAIVPDRQKQKPEVAEEWISLFTLLESNLLALFLSAPYHPISPS
jgi:hypothetical protein